MPNTLCEQAAIALATVSPDTPHPVTQKVRTMREIRRTPGFENHNLRDLADAVDWAVEQAETARLFAELREPVADGDVPR